MATPFFLLDMACRGVFFSLTEEQTQKLLGCESDAEVLSYVQDEIEEVWDEQHLCQTDKAWDAIHRCLTDGVLDIHGKDPLTMCILGGKQLHSRTDDFIVAFKTASEVQLIAKAIAALTPDAIRERFATIVAAGYEGSADEDDREYTVAYFKEAQSFYAKAAAENLAVIFTVDQ